jgi:L-alanine-DL-glutamate epimerase-like enolase superfamily enzyme
MKLTVHSFRLPTRHPFTISRGTVTEQATLVVELEQDGVRGYGEAPEVGYYGATIDRIAAALKRAAPAVEGARLGDPDRFWEDLRPVLADSSFALCALDNAAWDLWGKLQGQPVWRLWGLSLQACPPSDYTIGIDAIDVMVGKLREYSGWPVYKIKLGTPDDLAIVRALRAETGAVFRVDANCAWRAAEALRKAAALKDLGVELVEQPLPPDRWDDMADLFERSPLPLVADESCQVEDDVDRCAERFHGINIKLVKCGGLTPARRMIARARQLGMKVMVGCFTQSTVGISAAAQLLPLLDYADLDGAVLLADDVATGVRLEQGRVVFPDRPGCGVQLIGRD